MMTWSAIDQCKASIEKYEEILEKLKSEITDKGEENLE